MNTETTGAAAQFEEWWSHYPEKIGKEAARKAFKRAVKLATLEELSEGVQRYCSTKPRWRSWCHPATWLNAQRWLDQPAGPNGKVLVGVAKYVFVEEATPEYDAWRKTGLIGRYRNPKNMSQVGMHVPSQWPDQP